MSKYKTLKLCLREAIVQLAIQGTRNLPRRWDMLIYFELLMEIESKRQEMINLAFERGMSSSLTVKISQELDDLLNRLGEFERTAG